MIVSYLRTNVITSKYIRLIFHVSTKQLLGEVLVISRII